METKDHGLHEGFMGEAMRKAGDDVPSDMGTDPSTIHSTTNEKNDTNVSADETIGEVKITVNKNMETTEKLTSKVIAGKNAQELESKLNEFLTLMPANMEIEKTEFSTTASGLYIVVLYKNPLTRV